MRDFPSCFGENGIQVADSSSSSTSKNAQNLVTCVYQCRIRGRPCFITVTWTKSLMGQGLSIGIDDSANQCLCKIDIKRWLFSKRKGSKSLEAYSCKIDVYWDLCSAKFGSGPEPFQGFCVAVVANKQMVLLLGDMKKEACKKTGATRVPSSAILVAKKDHVFGKRVLATKALFCDNGRIHDLIIEFDRLDVSDPCLIIRVDGKALMQVKRLRWKFRGNHTILVQVKRLFATSLGGNAVFLFKTSGASEEKLWFSQNISSPSSLQWSFSQRFQDSKTQNPGFSLILYAWKNE